MGREVGLGYSIGPGYSMGPGYSLSGPGYPVHSTSITQKGIHVRRELHILENKQIDTDKQQV